VRIFRIGMYADQSVDALVNKFLLIAEAADPCVNEMRFELAFGDVEYVKPDHKRNTV